MKQLIEHLKNKTIYSLACIKNRYPCKLMRVKNLFSEKNHASVVYKIAIKFNFVESGISEILDNPDIIEKFHPMDGVKLGFLAASDILLKEFTTIGEARKKYNNIANNLFEGLTEE